jgi:hypothetical protein
MLINMYSASVSLFLGMLLYLTHQFAEATQAGFTPRVIFVKAGEVLLILNFLFLDSFHMHAHFG